MRLHNGGKPEGVTKKKDPKFFRGRGGGTWVGIEPIREVNLKLPKLITVTFIHVCTCMSVDTLMLEKVEISGPPPPARLDHAMCTVYLPTTPATTTGDHRSKKSTTAEGMIILLSVVPKLIYCPRVPAKCTWVLWLIFPFKYGQERIMRKEGRGEEHDTITHLIKFQVFTHASRVTNFSTHTIVQCKLKSWPSPC